MKTAAVDRIYTMLLTKQQDAVEYERLLALGARFTTAWDEPRIGAQL